MADNKVMFEGILLKPAMVTPGACFCPLSCPVLCVRKSVTHLVQARMSCFVCLPICTMGVVAKHTMHDIRACSSSSMQRCTMQPLAQQGTRMCCTTSVWRLHAAAAGRGSAVCRLLVMFFFLQASFRLLTCCCLSVCLCRPAAAVCLNPPTQVLTTPTSAPLRPWPPTPCAC